LLRPDKLKVLYIDDSIGFGGAVKSLSLVLSSMPDVEPILISSQNNDIIEKWFKGIKVYKSKTLIDYRLKERIVGWLEEKVSFELIRRLILKAIAFIGLIDDIRSIIHISWIAKKCKVELIHTNTGFNSGGITAARILGMPCLVHFRGIFTKKRGKGTLTAMSHTTHMIGVSNAVSKGVYEAGMPPDKITTIYDPVDMAAFDKYRSQRAEFRNCIGLKETDVAVGIFGRVIPWKGQLEFVYSALSAVRENRNIKAVIVGDESDGAPDYFNRIKDVINSSGCSENFILTGYQEDVERFYIAMDIVVHASIEPEPFGMVIPEGMAAEKPVIAADAGGPAEIVSPGIDGFLVPPGNIDKMAGAILELANNPDKRKIMGTNGYNKVKNLFTIPHIASQVDKVYQDILCKSKT